MRWPLMSAALVLLGAVGGYLIAPRPAGFGPGSAAATLPGPAWFEVAGKTQPVPGRRATIAPAVGEPVVAVLVRPGDRVHQGQPLVTHGDYEARADVRAKTAALEALQASLAQLQAQPREEERAEAHALLDSARVNARQARSYLGRLRPAWEKRQSRSRSFMRRKRASCGAKPKRGRRPHTCNSSSSSHCSRSCRFETEQRTETRSPHGIGE